MKKTILILLSILTSACLFAQDGYQKALSIQIKTAAVSDSENGPDNKSRVFSPGSTVYIKMEVTGLQKDSSNNYIIQADFLMTGSGLSTVLNEGRIIDQSLAATSPKVIFDFTLTLGNELKPGRYNIQVTVRDAVAKKYNNQNIAIDIK